MKVREIPDFNIEDIMGEFETDNQGNFIIIKDGKTLRDKHKWLINKWGYLIDGEGNVINNQGTIIFKFSELDINGEIPAPYHQDDEDYVWALRKKQKKLNR